MLALGSGEVRAAKDLRDIVEQARVVFEGVRRVLASAGAGPEDIVKVLS